MNTETSILLIGAGLFIYFIVYKKYRFFGNIAFMLLGLSLIMIQSDNSQIIIGMLVMVGSFLSLIFDGLRKLVK